MSKLYDETIVLNDPYVPCSRCGGSGMRDGLYAIETCSECNGNCVVRDRDDKGRFRTRPYTMYHIGNGVYGHKPPAKVIPTQPVDGDNQ